FQAEDGIRDRNVTGVQTCALPISTADLGALGMLLIRVLKALAVPLVLFAILDGFVKHDMRAKSAGKLLLVCAMNVTVAFCIGLKIGRASCRERVEGVVVAVSVKVA